MTQQQVHLSSDVKGWYQGTKAFIEALTGIPVPSVGFGWTTDPSDGEYGFYDGTGWTWISSSGGGITLANVYPIGSIYISVVSTNPATLFGFGTWVAFATGRVLVGIDAGQTEFDTVEETGGAKDITLTVGQMPTHGHTQDAHNHTQNAHDHTQNVRTNATGFGTSNPARGTATGTQTQATTDTTVATNQAATATNQNTGGGGSHSNLQPYIVVYMWKRTA